jgi:predicted phosphodiesterase
MRLAVIADIHGNELALQAVLADIAAQGIDDIVNLGDCFSGPLEPGKVAERLTALDIPTVRGNHDRYLIEQSPEAMGPSDRIAHGELLPGHLDWIRALPEAMVHRGEFYMCHATPKDDNRYWLEEVLEDGSVRRKSRAEIEALAEGIDHPVILFAHSHLPAMLRLSDGRLLINPGSVGCPGYDDVAPYPHKIEAGHPLASYAIIEKGADGFIVGFRNVPYDHMTMSRLAASYGRPQWASALATGRLE